MTVEVPTIVTERLVLRPFVLADADAFIALNLEPEVARFLTPTGQPLAPEDLWRQMAMLAGHWQLRGYGMWAVAERERPERLIGRVGPHEPLGWPDYEIGWAIAREHWGRGYATEAAREAIRWSFESAGRERVVSLIHPDNARSRAVAERVGERRVGEWSLRGTMHDLYALDRDDWVAARPA